MTVATQKPTKGRHVVAEAVSMGAAADRIDETNHVIKHVKVVGLKSKHGYEYTLESLRNAAPMYEGVRVFVGHPTNKNDLRSGSYGERIGVIRNFTVESDGGYGDLHYNPHHPQAAQLVYDVKHNPEVLGLSHHAFTTPGMRGGKRVIESIDKVNSVDLVNAPATTRGVFESEGDVPMPKTLKQLIADAEPKSLVVLEDMMAGGAMPADMPVESTGGDSDEQIKAAFEAAVVAKFRDSSLDSKATLAAIKDILNAYDKLTAKKPADKPAEESTKTESLESLRNELDSLKRRDEVRDLAAKEKVELSDVNLKAAVALESEDDRKAFVKGLPKIEAGGRDRDVQRPRRSQGVLEAGGDTGTGKEGVNRVAGIFAGG